MTVGEAFEAEKDKWDTEKADLDASLRDENIQDFILRKDNWTDLGIIEDYWKKYLAAQAEEIKTKEDTELVNAEIDKLKEEVVVLTRANEELKGSLKNAEKDLSLAKKGKENSKAYCNTA